MSTRITIVDVRRQFTDRYVPILHTLGGADVTEGLSLEKITGGYVLLDKDRQAAPGVTGHGMSVGYIGSTAAEAYATIQTIAKTLEWVQAQL